MNSKVVSLADAFYERPERFFMLEKGIPAAGWTVGGNILEIGCARGDAAFFMAGRGFHVTAVDLDHNIIKEAQDANNMKALERSVQFLCADAAKLPFPDNEFDGIYSEAAFSIMPDKSRCLAEYARVIKPGGTILINDFAVKVGPIAETREAVAHIPCFAGVETVETYKILFDKAGFQLHFLNEAFDELLRIALWLAKVYNVHPGTIGGYLLEFFQMGVLSKPSCSGIEQNSKFFKDVQLTYCQMLYGKR